MRAALSTQCLIGLIIFLILLITAQRKLIHRFRHVALFFLFYLVDNLAITLANHFPPLQITPNHVWEGFLFWGWSGKTYSILAILIVLHATRSLVSFEEVGLTIRQHSGSIPASLAVILLIVLYSVGLAFSSPKGEFDSGLLLYLAILPGLNEELVYRGVLPACLDRFFPKDWVLASAKTGWSTIIATMLFGLLHGMWLDDHFEFHVEMVWIRNALFSGFIFAWLRERTGSLIMPMIAHGAWDFFLF